MVIRLHRIRTSRRGGGEAGDLQRGTVGIYFWKRGKDFVKAANKMIAANARTNGEFYIAPTYNYTDDPIYRYPVDADRVHPLGTPEDVEKFQGVAV